MIDGKRVVAWTPYGREKTISILAEYMRRDHEIGLIDEWWLCLNTDPDQVGDLRYGYNLAKSHKFIKTKDRPNGMPRRTPKQRNTGYFYQYMTDVNTIYVRLDDDLVYVHSNAIENLVRARIEMPDPVALFGLCWNNAITSWYLQQCGIIPTEFGVVGEPFCMDSMGWANGDFAVKIHNLLLDKIESGKPQDVYLYQDMPLRVGQQFSVSYFASRGDMYAKLPEPGVLRPDEEENWHSVHQPKQIDHPNIIIGNSLVSHYTFGPQQRQVFASDVLDRYRAIATKLTN